MGILCLNCGHDNLIPGKYCGQCGGELVVISPFISCPLCGENNLLDTKFCVHCRHQISESVPPGIPLPRALAWREQFISIGWFNTKLIDAIPEIQAHMPNADLPSANDPLEPYIMAVQLLWSEPWKLQQITVNGRNFRGFWQPVKAILYATRSRLITVQLNDKIHGTIWHKDIVKVDGFGNLPRGTVIGNTGTMISWEVKAPGPGIVDIVKIETADDPVQLIRVHEYGSEKLATQLGFLAIIDCFIKEIASVKAS